MFDVARDITEEMSSLRYEGRAWIWSRVQGSRDVDYQMSRQPLIMDFKTCTYLFGGASYHVHSENDNSKFSHILPGVHDIDLMCQIISVDTETPGVPRTDQVSPFDEHVMKDLMSRDNEDVLHQPGAAPYIFRKMIDRMKRRLESVRPTMYYYRRTDSGSDPDEILVVPSSIGERVEGIFYQEIVNDIFRVLVAQEADDIKVQIEVTVQMGDFTGHDHVFEIVIPNKLMRVRSDCDELVNVDGIFLDTKRTLFQKNMISAIHRRYMAEALVGVEGQEFEALHAFGKCALDILRLTYIILTDLDSDSPWVTTPIDVHRLKWNLFVEMRKTADFVQRTPIDYFVEYMEYLAPCIDRSGVGAFRLERNPVSSELMAEILRLFSNFSSEFLGRETAKLAKTVHDASEAKGLLFKPVDLLVRQIPPHKRMMERMQTRYMEDWSSRDFEVRAEVHRYPREFHGGLFQKRGSKMYVTLDDNLRHVVERYYVKGTRIYFDLDDGRRVSVGSFEFNGKVLDAIRLQSM
ncbi:EsV-1-147 [Ectocarpus siliculosus]|uniref:EsV-1-147 n=1 Tax=Ectocarpus siliculosus TaxID=2880 RepID=D8LPK9_ECTSI|nr:EsV-1-147 [Ectocarpus siliculosus]|eukprot:CBN80481.1 EsV-1-147 [Ectocarpus siliculosus]